MYHSTMKDNRKIGSFSCQSGFPSIASGRLLRSQLHSLKFVAYDLSVHAELQAVVEHYLHMTELPKVVDILLQLLNLLYRLAVHLQELFVLEAYASLLLSRLLDPLGEGVELGVPVLVAVHHVHQLLVLRLR